MIFTLKSQYSPTGDQPEAIRRLTANIRDGIRHQTLLGVTGSGKTFTMANVVAEIQKPTLVISHNKTLAAQLYQEFKSFFPESAVHYFVSYYDYYQPEAYLPRTDTYIEKEAKINETIDALRHASTASLLTRKDTLIVASVSCIYGLGSPEEYQKVSLPLTVGMRISVRDLTKKLITLRYLRNPLDPRQGHFRVRDSTTEIYLPSGEELIAVEIEAGKIISLTRRPATVGAHDSSALSDVRIFPAKHFVTPQEKLSLAVANIRQELKDQLAHFKTAGKVLEAARLEQRTNFDMEMLESNGFVNGIENYSRQLDFRDAGSPPHTLLDYFRFAHGDDWLLFIDESHATLPQVRGMYHGDRARKETLINYGFRLPSAADNRPLTFAEFNQRITQTTYVSATPAPYELQLSESRIVEQIIRPTGIVDPKLEVRPTAGQIQDVVREVKLRVTRGERTLVMALTKRLAEDIAEYLREAGINAEYLHSEIKTLDRPDILQKLRAGEHDVLVGINLLREGLDLPEVSLITILDADKEGFLRNTTTLLQIIGRAARHLNGTVILYGDTVTESMRAAIQETNRRRTVQEAYNHKHGITPRQIVRDLQPSLIAEEQDQYAPLNPNDPMSAGIIKELERAMKRAVKAMNFECAAQVRDQLKKYRV